MREAPCKAMVRRGTVERYGQKRLNEGIRLTSITPAFTTTIVLPVRVALRVSTDCIHQ